MYWFLLVAGAVVMAVYVVAKICHRQLATSDAVFWFLFSFFLIIMALFPGLVFALSSSLGFESPANFVFLRSTCFSLILLPSVVVTWITFAPLPALT